MRLPSLPTWHDRAPILAPRFYGGATLGIALLTILTVVAMTSAGALGQASAWLNGPNANTISISFAAGSARQGQARFDRLVRKLVATDGVLAFRRNRGSDGDDPIVLVDVYMDPGAEGRADVAAELAAILPGAEIEDPYSGAGSFAHWIGPATWSTMLAALVLLLWLGSAISTAAQKMRAVHALEVKVMQMLGASRVQISRPFERRVVRRVLIASVIGVALTTILFVMAQARSTATMAEALNLPATIGFSVALAPVLLVLVGKLVTRLAVFRSLR